MIDTGQERIGLPCVAADSERRAFKEPYIRCTNAPDLIH